MGQPSLMYEVCTVPYSLFDFDVMLLPYVASALVLKSVARIPDIQII